jgi:hypothetical protein
MCLKALDSWAVMKNHIKKIQHEFDDIVDAIDETLKNEERSFQN